MKFVIFLLVTIFLFISTVGRCDSVRYAYDYFYNNDVEFKKFDSDLNAVFKTLLKNLDWASSRILIDEQRKWHRNLFPLLVDNKISEIKPLEAAKFVLKERIKNLRRMLDDNVQDKIMGMPISFGMSKKYIAQKLGNIPLSMLDARADNDIIPWKIQIFGEKVPVTFNFMTTKLELYKSEDNTDFRKFSKLLHSISLANNIDHYSDESVVLSTLCAISVGSWESRQDFNILVKELSKKYKRAYPQYPPLVQLLKDGYFLSDDVEDTTLVNPSNEYFFENKQNFIVINGSWGTMEGGFDITYISKPWLSLHIDNIQMLNRSFYQSNNIRYNLAILPANAGIKDVIYAIGGSALKLVPKIGGYYYIEKEYNEDNNKEIIQVYMTPKNTCMATGLSYIVKDQINNFEENLIEKLQKKYKKLQETPQDVLNFIGYGNNYDLDFESEDNFIHIGSTPHFAIQHEITVINKKELIKYMPVFKDYEAKNDKFAKKHEHDVLNDSTKF